MRYNPCKLKNNEEEMKMKKIAAMLCALILLVTLLTACGGETAGQAKGVKVIPIPLTEEEYAFGVDKNQPELLEQANAYIAQILSDGTFNAICEKYFSSGDLEPIVSAKPDRGKDQLIVATNAAFEPFEYLLGENYYGIDMEIAKGFAEYLGKELVIMNMDFDAVCLSVSQGKCDIAMAGLTVKEDRKEFVDFTMPYYQASQMILVRDDDTTMTDCKTAQDVEAILNACDKSTKIGVQLGTTGQYYTEGDEGWDFAGFPVTCVGYKSGALAAQDMLNGNINYVIIDEDPANYIANAINGGK